jgi:hypothetical protein
MPDTLQPQSLTSYINEIRRIDPPKKSAMIIPLKTQANAASSKKEKHIVLPDMPFEDWNLPPQAEGSIKCSRHDFL